MKYLFLDDVRIPEQVGNYMMPVGLRPMYRKEEWEIVRSYQEFVDWILQNGLPDVISFDHDLAEVHYNPDTQKEFFKYLPETGYDCAKWLVDFCMYEHLPLPIFYVHSMNPIGAENIRAYLENYNKQTVKDYSKDPFFVKKAEDAKKFLEEHPLPDEFKQKDDEIL